MLHLGLCDMMSSTKARQTMVLFQLLFLILLGFSRAWTPRTSLLQHIKHDVCDSNIILSASDDGASDNGKSGDSSKNKNNEENDEDSKRRMAAVRALQIAFYSPQDGQHPSLSESSGILSNLPLVREHWTEVPGRSDVLNVHDPVYTNMFEKILYGPKPMYYGHLYLEEGSKNLKTKDPGLQLSSWRFQEQQRKLETKPVDEDDISFISPRSAVVGCLMKISDYRRMANGRLLLLVHAMERFVVHDVAQRLPYAIADVQIIPDLDEVDPNLNWAFEQTESDVNCARAMAITESLELYHNYEYDADHVLPLPDGNDLVTEDIAGSNIARVMPFTPYSKTLDPPPPMENSDEECVLHWDEARLTTGADLAGQGDETLELRLLKSKILNTPPMQRLVEDLDTTELEYKLWLTINEFLVKSRSPVSPILLGLIPPNTKWPSNFNLNKIGKGLAKLDSLQNKMRAKTSVLEPTQATTLPAKTTINHDYVAIPSEYPEHRRQRRLSYSAAVLLEDAIDGDKDEELRQILLETPSTHARLAMLLRRFNDLLHSAEWTDI